jgi:hypothetical protein
MDGTSKNGKVGGKLFRPVSQSQALDQFTPLIYDMLSRKVRIIPNAAADGIHSIVVYGRESRFWTLRTEDYDKCLKIVRRFTYPSPFNITPRVIIEQIRSYIAVEFQD